MPEQDITTEIWKAVVGYEGLYEVSNIGRVRRIADWLMPKGGVHRAQGLLRLKVEKVGYIRATLYRNGKKRIFGVARLVLMAHGPTWTPGMQVNHRNGIKGDDAVGNLEWVTPKQNIRHAVALAATGQLVRNVARGERCGRSKLTTAQVLEILELGRQMPRTQIAERFGVAYATVRHILRRETWRHVHQ